MEIKERRVANSDPVLGHAPHCQKSPPRVKDIPEQYELRIAIDSETLTEIRELRRRQYRVIYPDLDIDNDLLDDHSIILYTRNSAGQINSTARLGIDGPWGLLDDTCLDDYRAAGKRLIEWGRFVIEEGNTALLKRYYESVFTLSRKLGYDAVLMGMKPKDISLHQRLIGVDVVKENMGLTYGGPFSLACVVWELESTNATFFKWINKT